MTWPRPRQSMLPPLAWASECARSARQVRGRRRHGVSEGAAVADGGERRDDVGDGRVRKRERRDGATTAPRLWTRERAPVVREGAAVANEGERHDDVGERCDDVGKATMKRRVRVRKYDVQGATCVSGSAATTR
jgi:hypothetical protein